MIIDNNLEFCDATALDTSGTDTDLIGDVLDLGSTGREIGLSSQPLYLVIQVDTAVTSAGNATVQFHLASDAAAAIAVDGTASYHWSSKAFAKATLVAGFTLVVPLPTGSGAEYERYLGILTTTGTAAVTAGKINAFITTDAQRYVSTADAL